MSRPIEACFEIVASAGTWGGRLAAELDLDSLGVGLDEVERFHEVGDFGGDAVGPCT